MLKHRYVFIFVILSVLCLSIGVAFAAEDASNNLADASSLDANQLQASDDGVLMDEDNEDEPGRWADLNKLISENESDELENHVMYLTPRRFQVEAVTGTVIPSYLEEKTDYMKPVLEERIDGIVPQESIEQDDELKKEINERLKEYKHLDILNEGDTICSIEKLRTSQILYRWAYLTRYKGMKFPMIALRGYKSIEKMNVKSRKKGSYGKHVVIPLSIARTDAIFLNQHGISFEGTIIREDHLFEYLYNSVGAFNLYFEESLDEVNQH